MDSKLLEVVAGFGPLGVAAAAIFWMSVKMSQRLDTLTDNFQEQLREQAQGHTEREGALRDRYDSVIATYNLERLQVIQGISAKLDSIEKELGDVEGNTKIIIEMFNSDDHI
tara:strand:+ start:2026 stop:2361 length:336 start_codon:yes stop_codon:yes gene_type:complete